MGLCLWQAGLSIDRPHKLNLNLNVFVFERFFIYVWFICILLLVDFSAQRQISLWNKHVSLYKVHHYTGEGKVPLEVKH